MEPDREEDQIAEKQRVEGTPASVISPWPIVVGDSTRLTVILRGLFPGGVSAAFVSRAAEGAALYPVEADCVRNAVWSRRREFAVGRACARRAMAALGVTPVPIAIGPDRAPVWPAGVLGSITHCEGFVGAAVSRVGPFGALGFDAEPASPLGSDLEALICTAAELDWVATASPPSSADWPKVLFCAKEAVHKCIAGSSGVMLDFRELVVTLHPERRAFSARLVDDARDCPPGVSQLAGRFAVTPEFVFATALICRSPE